MFNFQSSVKYIEKSVFFFSYLSFVSVFVCLFFKIYELTGFLVHISVLVWHFQQNILIIKDLASWEFRFLLRFQMFCYLHHHQEKPFNMRPLQKEKTNNKKKKKGKKANNNNNKPADGTSNIWSSAYIRAREALFSMSLQQLFFSFII